VIEAEVLFDFSLALFLDRSSRKALKLAPSIQNRQQIRSNRSPVRKISTT
jgi:hypothetical protein